MTNALIAEKLNKEETLSIKDASTKNKTMKTMSRRTTLQQPETQQSFRSGTTMGSTAAKGGVVKTIVLPHEDLNRLGTDGQLLIQVMEQ